MIFCYYVIYFLYYILVLKVVINIYCFDVNINLKIYFVERMWMRLNYLIKIKEL